MIEGRIHKWTNPWWEWQPKQLVWAWVATISPASTSHTNKSVRSGCHAYVDGHCSNSPAAKNDKGDLEGEERLSPSCNVSRNIDFLLSKRQQNLSTCICYWTGSLLGPGPTPAQSGTSRLFEEQERIQEWIRVRVNGSFILVEKQGGEDAGSLVASLTRPLRKKGKYTSDWTRMNSWVSCPWLVSSWGFVFPRVGCFWTL